MSASKRRLSYFGEQFVKTEWSSWTLVGAPPSQLAFATSAPLWELHERYSSTICLSDKWRRIHRPLRSLTQNSQCGREVIHLRICSLQSMTSSGVGIGCHPLIHAVPRQIPPHFHLCILSAHSRFARGTHVRVIGKRVCRTQRTARNPGRVNRCSVHRRSSDIIGRAQ